MLGNHVACANIVRNKEDVDVDVGPIDLGASSLNRTLSVTDPQNPRYQGWGLSSDETGYG